MKFLAKLLAALALAGVILLIVGLCLGGKLYTGYVNGRLWPLDFGFHFNSHAAHFDSHHDGLAALDGIPSVSAGMPDVTEVRLNVSAGSCTIRTGEGGALQYAGSVEAEQDGGVLTLDVAAGDADVTLPDFYFDAISVDVAGGDVDIEMLRADSCAVSLHAGDLTIEEIEASACAVSVAMGSAEIEELDAAACVLSLTAGELNVEELNAFDISASCTGGSMLLGLEGRAQDYSCEASALAGTVTWDGKPLSAAGFSGEATDRSLALNVTGGSLALRSD